VRAADLEYDLPPECIAQEPAPRREDARLLVLGRAGGDAAHRRVADLGDLLRPGDLLVLNDTRVLPARVVARRASGGAVEVLFLEPADAPPGAWWALARGKGRLREGETLDVEGGGRLVLLGARGEGRWLVGAEAESLPDLMARAGRVPLPPYIRREAPDPRDARDAERYQTVYARRPGAVAAPTAGLHLTEALLAALGARGIGVAALTLHVGPGTFSPVRGESLSEHGMESERYEIPEATAARWRETRAAGGRVVAVGTTCVRALEAAARDAPDGAPQAGAGRTDLFIAPGHVFRAVDALLTNFHLPRSTLLALVFAFAGRERVLGAYAEAIREGYRFYSYGDAMLIA